ncbi:hypothetical protein AB0N99_36730 [Streptomyces sp. NPDC093272]|uniref:hypothetical protein n=1 Tax=unclassified Streptomyces TaxID=2593676 RepID=UPI00341B291B
MSDRIAPADDVDQETSACCAAIAELQRRAQQRTAEPVQDEGDHPSTEPSSPGPTA